ncbi:hypothetical protein K435DRAFT_965140 [Dendrothele bispora CBS 962.96]|uniref:Uncharacterized protein n=1 Tax=Dendrothele bispora (strain CBS 962.96) TaxID=1314807 RepID=A0A4S8M6W0_DENBC|nr:hypothetical protein K435DRAFT_965140 [Dendrothele bispora CBS 962.96]
MIVFDAAIIIPRDGQIPILELLNIAKITSVCVGSTLLLSWEGGIPPYEVRAVQIETTPEGVGASTLFASFDALNATSCCIDIPIPNSNDSNFHFFFLVKSFDIQLETSNKISIIDCSINDPTDDQCTPPTSVPSSSTSTPNTSMASVPGASSSLYTASDTSIPSTSSTWSGPSTEPSSVPVTITYTTIIQPSTIISVSSSSSQQKPEGGLGTSWMGETASTSSSPTQQKQNSIGCCRRFGRSVCNITSRRLFDTQTKKTWMERDYYTLRYSAINLVSGMGGIWMYAFKFLSLLSVLAVIGTTFAQDSSICKSNDDCPEGQICCVNLAPEDSNGCIVPLNPKFGIGPVCLHG